MKIAIAISAIERFSMIENDFKEFNIDYLK